MPHMNECPENVQVETNLCAHAFALQVFRQKQPGTTPITYGEGAQPAAPASIIRPGRLPALRQTTYLHVDARPCSWRCPQFPYQTLKPTSRSMGEHRRAGRNQ